MGFWVTACLILICRGMLVEGSNRNPRSDVPLTSPMTPEDDEESPTEIPCAHRNQCGSPSEGLPFYARNCFCDPACRAYGDCCRNYAPDQDSGIPLHPASSHLLRGILSCRRNEDIDTSYEMYIADTCPRGYPVPFVRNKCENELVPEVFYRLPVTGRTSGVLYRNVYCAICAGDTDVVFWELAYKCNGLEDFLINGTVVMEIGSADEFRRLTTSLRCTLELLPPPGKNPRKCKSYTDKCARKWQDERIAKKCKSYTAYVYLGLEVFKNRHCAICNNIEEGSLSCEDTRTPWLVYERKPSAGEEDSGSLPPLFVVYDINTGSAAIRRGRGNGIRTPTGNTIALGQCANGSVYDIITDECRAFDCGNGNCSHIITTPSTTSQYVSITGAVTSRTTALRHSTNKQTTGTTERGRVTRAGRVSHKTKRTTEATRTTVALTTRTTRRTEDRFKTMRNMNPSHTLTNPPRKPTSTVTLGTSITSTVPTPLTTTTTIATTSTTTTSSTSATTAQVSSTISTTPTTTTESAIVSDLLVVPSTGLGRSTSRAIDAYENDFSRFEKVWNPIQEHEAEVENVTPNATTTTRNSTTTTTTVFTTTTTPFMTKFVTRTTTVRSTVNVERDIGSIAPKSAFREEQNCSDTIIMFQFNRLQSLASFIGTLTSLASLLVSFITILVLPSLRNVRGRVLLSLIVCIFAGQLLYLFAVPSNQPFVPRPVCYWVGSAMHYCVLSVFFWINVLAFDICVSVIRDRDTNERCSRFIGYSLYAWLTPAGILAACLVVDFLRADHLFIRPCYGEGVCFLTGRYALLLTLALPAGVLAIVSLFLYFLSMSHTFVDSTRGSRGQTENRKRITLCTCLTLIVILTWVAAFVAVFRTLEFAWWVFVVLGSTQGNFICVVFICTRKVFEQLRNKGQNAKGSSPTHWSYQKDIYTSTMDRARFAGSDTEIISHETCM